MLQEESIALLSSPHVYFRMLGMLLPIPRVPLSQLLIVNHKQILRIIFLCRLGKIEAAGNHCLSIDDHDLVMGNGMLCIYTDIPELAKKSADEYWSLF